MKLYIIYVPGLGDRQAPLIWAQKQFFRSWRFNRSKVEIFQIAWTGDVAFEKRLGKLIERIDELHERGERISLIGTSAGASAVINAYARRKDKIHGVVCICGALRGADSLPEAAFKLHPRFKESIELVPASLKKLDESDRQSIMTMRPYFDLIVLPKNAMVDGARNRRILSFGHLTSIAYFLNGKSFMIRRFLRRVSKSDTA